MATFWRGAIHAGRPEAKKSHWMGGMSIPAAWLNKHTDACISPKEQRVTNCKACGKKTGNFNAHRCHACATEFNLQKNRKRTLESARKLRVMLVQSRAKRIAEHLGLMIDEKVLSLAENVRFRNEHFSDNAEAKPEKGST